MIHRSLLALAIALLLSGCALIDPHNIAGRRLAASSVAGPVPTPASSALSASDREAAYDFVWRTINDRYYDPKLNGVDWKAVGERYRPAVLLAKDDDAFWDELDRMTGEMKDAHTRVDSPKRAELIRKEESVTLGFAFAKLDGRLVVSSVHSDSDAWWAGVRPGMVLAAIEGEPAAQAYEKLIAETRSDSTERSRHMRAVRRVVAGELGSKASFTFEREDGTRFDATLARRRVSTSASASHRILPSGFGYVRLSQWAGGATDRAIGGLREMKSAPGMIIDLRSNPGGSLFSVNAMLKAVLKEKTNVGRAHTRTGKPITMLFGAVPIVPIEQEISGGPEAYAGPVVVLVNAGSGSGSEFFSGAMQALGRATILGEPTCGCLLGFLGYAAIPGGGELAYSEVGFTFVNGKRIEGEGVLPDVPVPVTLADLRQGRDRALEQAVARLQAEAAKPAPAAPRS